MKKNPKQSSTALPSVVGTGLVALDLVFTDDSDVPTHHWAGGTCGNVLLALRYLGWESAPIARLRSGHAADCVLDDLRRWDVSTEFISLMDDGSTPVILQRIGRTSLGHPFHKFSLRCPNCGTRLPGYKPVLASTAQRLASGLRAPKVFFFDRVSRGALELAGKAAELGAAVVFEPSGVGNPSLFREAWELAHVVKYSRERLPELPRGVGSLDGVRIELETLGRHGLRYRSQIPGCKTKGWQQLDALPLEDVKDTAGAGDWCTAGMVDKLLRDGADGLNRIHDNRLRNAIRYGQGVAAWNCRFEGARGGMYSVQRGAFERQVERILRGAEGRIIRSADVGFSSTTCDSICPVCETLAVPEFKAVPTLARA